MKKLMPARTLASKNSSIGIFINNYTRQVKTPTIEQQNDVNSLTQQALTNDSKKQFAPSNCKRNIPALPVEKIYTKSGAGKSNSSKLVNKSDIISKDTLINQSYNAKSQKSSPKKQSLPYKQNQQKINLKIKSENENSIKTIHQSKKREINQQSQNILKLRESSSHSQLKTKAKSDEQQKRDSQPKTHAKQSHTPQSSQNFKQMKTFEMQVKMKKNSISEKIKASPDKKFQSNSNQKKPQIQQANHDKPQNKSLNRILSLYKKVVPDKIPTTFNIQSALNLNLTQKISEQLQSRGSQNESPRSNSCLKTSDLVFDLKAESLTKEEKFLKRRSQNSQTSQNQKRVQNSKNSAIQILKENAERKKQLAKNKTQQSTPLTSINTSQIESYMNQNQDWQNLSYDDLDAEFSPRFSFQSQVLTSENLKCKFHLQILKQQHLKIKKTNCEKNFCFIIHFCLHFMPLNFIFIFYPQIQMFNIPALRLKILNQVISFSNFVSSQ